MQSKSPQCSAGLRSATTRRMVLGTACRDTLRYECLRPSRLAKTTRICLPHKDSRAGSFAQGCFRNKCVTSVGGELPAYRACTHNSHVRAFIGLDRKTRTASSCLQDISDDTASLLSALTLQCCHLQMLQHVAYYPRRADTCSRMFSLHTQRLPGNRIGDHGV